MNFVGEFFTSWYDGIIYLFAEDLWVIVTILIGYICMWMYRPITCVVAGILGMIMYAAAAPGTIEYGMAVWIITVQIICILLTSPWFLIGLGLGWWVAALEDTGN